MFNLTPPKWSLRKKLKWMSRTVHPYLHLKIKIGSARPYLPLKIKIWYPVKTFLLKFEHFSIVIKKVIVISKDNFGIEFEFDSSLRSSSDKENFQFFNLKFHHQFRQGARSALFNYPKIKFYSKFVAQLQSCSRKERLVKSFWRAIHKLLNTKTIHKLLQQHFSWGAV